MPNKHGIDKCGSYTEDCFCFFVLQAHLDSDMGREEGCCRLDNETACPFLNIPEEAPAEITISTSCSWDAKPTDIRKDILSGMGIPREIIDIAGVAELDIVTTLLNEGQLIMSPLHRKMKRRMTSKQ